MSQLLAMIEDGQLLSTSWDPSLMIKMLTEVVHIFRDQQKRIVDLETKIETLAEKEALEQVKIDLDDFQTSTRERFNDVKAIVEKNKTEAEQQNEGIKETIESEKLSILSETRRLVTAELNDFVPNLSLDNPVLSDMNERIQRHDDMLEKYGELATQPVSGEVSALRVVQCEGRLGNLEAMLVSYPTVQGQVDSLQLQFPAVVKRLERRINEVQNGLAEKAPKKKGSQASLRPFMSGDITVPPGLDEHMTLGVEVVEVAPPENITKEEQEVEEEDNDEAVFESALQSQIKPVSLPDELPPITIPGESKRDDDDGLRKTAKQEPVVQVIEQKTYKTELSSSVRVVQELEWAKNMIQQHHDAIRQVQQGLRSQIENFDQVTDNLMRVNATNNSRISQLAQQQLHSQQDSDNVRRQMLDQIGKVQQKVYELSQQKPTIVTTPTTERRESPEHKVDKSMSGIPRASLPKVDTVPLLPVDPVKPENPVPQVTPTQTRHPVSVSSDSDESTDALEQPIPERKGREEPPQRKFVFTLSQFSTDDIEDMPPPVAMSAPVQTPAVKRKDRGLQTPDTPTHSHTRRQQVSKPPAAEENPPTPTKEAEEEPLPYLMSELHSSNPAVQSPIIHESHVSIGGVRLPGRAATEPVFQQLELEDERDELSEDVTEMAHELIGRAMTSAKEDMKDRVAEMQSSVDKALTMIDGKIDRDFVERLFNKFKVILGEINSKIDNLQTSFLDWVTRDELEMALQKFMNAVTEGGEGNIKPNGVPVYVKPKNQLAVDGKAVAPLKTKKKSDASRPRNVVQLLTKS